MNFNGKKSEEEKYIYLFKCTKKWRCSVALQECGPDVLGHPGPLVTGHHLPMSKSCFLVLGTGALGVAAKGPGLIWLAEAVLTVLNAAHFRLGVGRLSREAILTPSAFTCFPWRL